MVCCKAVVTRTGLGVWKWLLLKFKPKLAPPPCNAGPYPGPHKWGPDMEKHVLSLEGNLLPSIMLLGVEGVGSRSQVRIYSEKEKLRVPKGPACPTSKWQNLQRNNNTSDILKNML